MPPCLLKFTKIVLGAGQDMPTCIWQPWSISVAEAIRAHAILLTVLDTLTLRSPTLAGGLHALQGHTAGIPGIVMRLRKARKGMDDPRRLAQWLILIAVCSGERLLP